MKNIFAFKKPVDGKYILKTIPFIDFLFGNIFNLALERFAS